MTIEQLRTRCKTATEVDQAELLEMAFRAFFGEKPPRIQGGSPELTQWILKHNPFWTMLDAKAYESAALMIMREVLPGWSLQLYAHDHVTYAEVFLLAAEKSTVDGTLGRQTLDRGYGSGAKAALAVIAAIVDAKENENGSN